MKLVKLSVAAAGTLLSFLATGEAQAYTFTKIADSSGPFEDLGTPAINNNGTVAFWTDLDPPAGVPWDHSHENTQQFIMSGNGGLLTTIYDAYVPLLSYSSNHLDDEPDINDEGMVAFKVFGQPVRVNIDFESAMFAGNGGAITTIYPFWRKEPDSYGNSVPNNVGTPAINNHGTVVFSSENALENANFVKTFVSTNPKLSYITIPKIGLYAPHFNPTINDKGTIVFKTSSWAGVGSTINPIIVTSSNGRLRTIADNGGMFQDFGKPAINNRETLAFSASLDSGDFGIFTNSGGKINTIVDSTGIFAKFGDVAIDNQGNLAFSASLDVGAYGIFTGPDPVADKIIATGDTLFGSKVKGLGFRREGFNDAGQIAFFAELEDGTQGIYRADPDPEAPKSIPEPTSVLGLFTTVVLALVKQRKS